MKVKCFKIFILLNCFVLCFGFFAFSQDIKQPDVAGRFYPANPYELSLKIDNFLANATSQDIENDIFAIINPHAGYDYSGQVAAYGFKAIENKRYKTVVIIASSHNHRFKGASVYAKGVFSTPLGNVSVDSEFAKGLIDEGKSVRFEPDMFLNEHPIEAQIPFLQKVLDDFKIVPINIGSVDFSFCKDLAHSLANIIGKRKDVLIVASSDMYHGYDWQEAEKIDRYTLSLLEKMQAKDLYDNLNKGRAQLCGGYAVITTMLTAEELGHNTLKVLNYTNSAKVTKRFAKGVWTVGYASCVIDKKKGEGKMLNSEQRKRLLDIARSSIDHYFKKRELKDIAESDPELTGLKGAFVTLTKQGRLRGCIGRIAADAPLYQVVNEMAVEAAFSDPRFPPLSKDEFNDIEIEISVLSPLEKISDVNRIEIGKHGLLIKKGFYSGLLLPQVAADYGWDRITFLEHTCHKAGLPADAWRKNAQIFIFSAEVFSEKDIE